MKADTEIKRENKERISEVAVRISGKWNSMTTRMIRDKRAAV
jgi:hypothetical protein